MKTNDEIEILDFFYLLINNLEEYDLLTRRGLVAKHFKEARQKILDLKDKWERDAVRSALTQLKAPDSLLATHEAYNNIANFHNIFEYMGKEYDSCHICGFSPEAMNDEIDRIAELTKENK